MLQMLQMWSLAAFLTPAPPLYLDAPSFIWPTQPREEAFENRPIDFQLISLLWGFETICGEIASSFTLFSNSARCALIANAILSKSTFGHQLCKIWFFYNSDIFVQTVKSALRLIFANFVGGHKKGSGGKLFGTKLVGYQKPFDIWEPAAPPAAVFSLFLAAP